MPISGQNSVRISNLGRHLCFLELWYPVRISVILGNRLRDSYVILPIIIRWPSLFPRALISRPNIQISSQKLIVRILKSGYSLKWQSDNRTCPDIGSWLYKHKRDVPYRSSKFKRITNFSANLPKNEYGSAKINTRMIKINTYCTDELVRFPTKIEHMTRKTIWKLVQFLNIPTSLRQLNT
jgi:hypothetical protein